MAKALFTCFAPFNYFSTDRRRIFSSIDSTDEEVSELFFSLELDLQRLQVLLSDTDSISLQWCTEAMFLVQKMHSCLLPFFERSNSEDPFSWDGHASVIEEYMKETLDVLDLCNLIKSAILGVHRYRMMFDHATKRFSENELSKVKIERMMTKQDDYHYKSLGAKKWQHEKFYLIPGIRTSNKAKLKKDMSNVDVHVVCAIGKAMNVISLLILSSLLNPCPIKLADDDRETCCNVPCLISFSDSVRKLVLCFNKKLECSYENANTVLAENKEMIEGAISGFKYQEVMELDLKMLKQRSEAVRERSELFESAVNQVFEGVVKGRKRVLGLVSQNKFNLFDAL